ncbi:unnamed protein product [Zymoseptoria tritici ST99CH_3D1]|nr:unnamed protein product [Zymoseptoria tritici ST99CH_3D1]
MSLMTIFYPRQRPAEAVAELIGRELKSPKNTSPLLAHHQRRQSRPGSELPILNEVEREEWDRKEGQLRDQNAELRIQYQELERSHNPHLQYVSVLEGDFQEMEQELGECQEDLLKLQTERDDTLQAYEEKEQEYAHKTRHSTAPPQSVPRTIPTLRQESKQRAQKRSTSCHLVLLPLPRAQQLELTQEPKAAEDDDDDSFFSETGNATPHLRRSRADNIIISATTTIPLLMHCDHDPHRLSRRPTQTNTTTMSHSWPSRKKKQESIDLSGSRGTLLANIQCEKAKTDLNSQESEPKEVSPPPPIMDEDLLLTVSLEARRKRNDSTLNVEMRLRKTLGEEGTSEMSAFAV